MYGGHVKSVVYVRLLRNQRNFSRRQMTDASQFVTSLKFLSACDISKRDAQRAVWKPKDNILSIYFFFVIFVL
jgi:hypothetical protein